MGYKDLREWMTKLESEGELRRINALVDWDLELGAVTTMSRRKGYTGLLFENIKDYQDARCRKLFTGGLVNKRQLAMMFGLPPDTVRKEMVEVLRNRLKNPVRPVSVGTGSIKENIVRGEDVSLNDFPAPFWNKLDGGRYFSTFGAVVTRDPNNKIMNVGMYRGMIVDKKRMAMVITAGQHIGQHFTKYKALGREMPIAIVLGWDPSLPFCSCAAIPKNVCEYDIMGSIRQQPVELIKCETSDLEVPATAEIVVEGFVSPDESTYVREGPFGEFTGYYAYPVTERPVIRVECITYRNDPVFIGTLAGSLPGQPGEGANMMSVNWAAMACEAIDRAGVPGLVDLRFLPPSCETSVAIKIHKTYRGQGKQIAMTILGSSLPFQACKNIIVVDDDVDIENMESIRWAIDYRVNHMENDVVVIPGAPGIDIDPSIRSEQKGMLKFGGGTSNRTIIDATKNWSYGRKEEWDNDFYPPVVEPTDEMKELTAKRWKEYGFDE